MTLLILNKTILTLVYAPTDFPDFYYVPCYIVFHLFDYHKAYVDRSIWFQTRVIMQISSICSLSGYRGFTGRRRVERSDNTRFFKGLRFFPYDRLLTKIGASGVDLRVVVWVNEFLLGRPQRIRVGGQLSELVRINSEVPQGSVLGPLLSSLKLMVCGGTMSLSFTHCCNLIHLFVNHRG